MYHFNSSQELADALAQSVAADLQKVLKSKPFATLLVSGGRTPLHFFKALSFTDISWEQIKISLVDERMVGEKHPDSNAKLIKDHLLQNKAEKASFIPMYDETLDNKNALTECEKHFLKELFPADVIILGMGSDGHTASLFPFNEKLKEALDPESTKICISMTPSDAPHQRVSLTLKAILEASNLYLHFEGEEKQKVYEKAMAGDDDNSMPIRAVLHQNQKTLKVYTR